MKREEGLSQYWCEVYRRKRGASYKGFGPRDGATLARLSKVYGEPALRWIIARYLELEDDALVRNRGWDTGGLSMRARSLYIQRVKKFGEDEVALAKRTQADLKLAPPEVISLVEGLSKKFPAR